MIALLAALTWDPQVKGALYVILAVLILCGSAYLLLGTNMGARLGFQLAAAGLFGFLATIGIIWWVYGIGPIGRAPAWHAEGIVTGDLARSPNDALEDFPRGWDELEIEDPAVSDALPIMESQVVSEPGQRRMFASPSDYVPVGAYRKGGDSFGPFGLNFRPFDVFHEPHYLVIQVQQAAPPVVGEPARPDPEARPVAVVLLRDLGSERLNPAIFALSSTVIFFLLCYQLHTRDKQAAAARESGTPAPQPVSSSR